MTLFKFKEKIMANQLKTELKNTAVAMLAEGIPFAPSSA
jgi:hypothetical protein